MRKKELRSVPVPEKNQKPKKKLRFKDRPRPQRAQERKILSKFDITFHLCYNEKDKFERNKNGK